MCDVSEGLTVKWVTLIR